MEVDSGSAPPAKSPRFATVVARFSGILLAVAVLATLGSWGISSPAGSSPDDDYHLASIWCSSTSQSELCGPGKSPKSRQVSTALLKVACFAADATISGKCQENRNIFSEPKMVESKRGNFFSKYPPVFYEVNGLLASNDVPASVLAMRLLNLLLFLGVGIGLWFALPRHLKTSMVLMWSLTLVPLGLFIIPSTNPSSWAVTGVGGAFIAFLGLRQATGRRKWALGALFGFSAIMAAGARADAAVYVGLAVVAALALTWRYQVHTRRRSLLLSRRLLRWRHHDWRSYILPGAIALLVAVVLLFTRNTALTEPARSPLSPEEIAAGGFFRNPLSVLGTNIFRLPDLWAGAFGHFPLGWLDTGMPPLVSALAATACAVVLFVRLNSLSRVGRVVVVGLGIILTVIPLYFLQIRLAVVGGSFQPRYMLPLLVVFVGVFVLLKATETPWFSRSQALVLGVMLAVAQSVALYQNLSRYIRGDHARGGWNLDEAIKWWWALPVSPMTIWVVGSLAFALAITLVLHRISAHAESPTPTQ